MKNSLKALLALSIVGCCGDPPKIPSSESFTRVNVQLSEWKGHPGGKFELPKSHYRQLNKWLSTVETAKSQKYLFMGSVVIHSKSGTPISIAVYSEPDSGIAVLEFNGNKCYYRVREGTAKQLHSFLIDQKGK